MMMIIDGVTLQTRIIVATAESKCFVFRSREDNDVLQLCSEFVRTHVVIVDVWLGDDIVDFTSEECVCV